MTRLSGHFRVQHRYQRSVNLERDSELADSLEGYILTSRASETLERILAAYHGANISRAWTLTGAYGTGKSSFANFLASLCARKGSAIRKKADRLLQEQEDRDSTVSNVEILPEDGLVRAIVTGRREPLAHTIIRGLARGAELFWSGRPGRRPNAYEQVMALRKRLEQDEEIEARQIPELTHDLASAAGSGVLLMIDELGKLLEHAAQSRGADDLYLLQQLAELPAGEDDPPILLVGLLHQSFSEYGQALSSAERSEWEKIQGRFEDVPFTESPDQVLRLVGSAIESTVPNQLRSEIRSTASAWSRLFEERVEDPYITDMLVPERVAELYPLHPVSALILPGLCYRYAQNDRSLFTFLASTEPYALSSFLETHDVDGETLPHLRPAVMYDYFIDSARASGASRIQFHRWAEIHDIIHEARGLGAEEMDALKVIGVLNLVGSGGPVRASRELVLAALLNDPDDEEDRSRWAQVIDRLVEKQLVTHRRQVDEYRVWQGSDFDIEGAIKEQTDAESRTLSEILPHVATLSPIVVQRHSYVTGTLRYMETRFEEDMEALATMSSDVESADGIVVYWLGDSLPESVPKMSGEGRPIAIIPLERSQALEAAAWELFALQRIEKTEVALQSDGVARKEVRHRLARGREILDRILQEAITTGGHSVWLGGESQKVENLNRALSDLLDEVFHKAPVLWNEIINHRDLTSQGARAQRELITALLEAPDEVRLGIQGTGPDYSIYSSLLEKTKIHREENGEWGIYPPKDPSVKDFWEAVEAFCLSATDSPRPISELYDELQAPPFGVRQGVIPIFLAAFLVHRADDVSVYQDGSFLPVLRATHFELLVKDPQRFSVKHFALNGIRSELFRDLEKILRAGGAQRPTGARNATLLTVVRPLVQFAASLPRVTRNAINLSAEAVAVREALLNVREPDRLIFGDLPEAVGQQPFVDDEESIQGGRHEKFRKTLFEALKELQMHYPQLLESCQEMIQEAFGVREAGIENLRDNLRIRASYLVDQVIEARLKSFLVAAIDEDRDDREWLESLVMVIADKPAENWKRDDILGFELHVAELARRFGSLLALQDRRESIPKGFLAKRITITEPTGYEVDEVIWLDEDERSLIEDNATILVEKLSGRTLTHKQQRAILVSALERMLHRDQVKVASGTEDSGEKEEKRA